MNFDPLARYYRAMEWVLAGGILQRCRTAFLGHTSASRCALLLGEGPGRFLVELLRVNPRVEVVCLEQSPRMIEAATRELRRQGLESPRVRFEQADALQWKPPTGVFDLVVTHFFLDCFRREELERLVPRITASTSAGARWLLADFRVPEQGWQRCRARLVLALMYASFRSATGLSASQLTPPDRFLEAAGFRLEGRRVVNFGLAASDLWLRTGS